MKAPERPRRSPVKPPSAAFAIAPARFAQNFADRRLCRASAHIIIFGIAFAGPERPLVSPAPPPSRGRGVRLDAGGHLLRREYALVERARLTDEASPFPVGIRFRKLYDFAHLR